MTATTPVVLIPHRVHGNIYVRELGRAYQELGLIAVFGPENLFDSALQPTLVHLHWPEEQYRTYGDGPAAERIERLLERLDACRRNGARLVWTVHNIWPHEPDGKGDLDREAYQQILDRADLVHHHCQCSVDTLARSYRVPPSQPQIVVPHGHYLAYPNEISREAARARLGLPNEAFVYLHFGALRGYKGLSIVLAGFRRAPVAGKRLVVAGQPRGNGSRWGSLRQRLSRLASRRVHYHLRRVDAADIQIYVNAADAMVLGHHRGMNSGVAVLAMSFGRLVIAPQLGCLTDVLASGINLTYPAGDASALAAAMERAAGLDLEAAGRANREAARAWRWTDIATAVLEGLDSRPA